MFARPKNTKKPTTSVTVVNKIEAPNAGSIFQRCKIRGIDAPKNLLQIN